jgi:hypothetical protein
VGLVGAAAQVVGVVLASVGASELWSPWALVVGGVVLLVGPELGEAVRRR